MKPYRSTLTTRLLTGPRDGTDCTVSAFTMHGSTSVALGVSVGEEPTCVLHMTVTEAATLSRHLAEAIVSLARGTAEYPKARLA